MFFEARFFHTVNYEQGPLRVILEPLQGFYNHFPRGGAPGINLMMLEPWQFVSGGSGIISWGIRNMILEPLHFGAFLLSKNGVNNCT